MTEANPIWLPTLSFMTSRNFQNWNYNGTQTNQLEDGQRQNWIEKRAWRTQTWRETQLPFHSRFAYKYRALMFIFVEFKPTSSKRDSSSCSDSPINTERRCLCSSSSNRLLLNEIHRVVRIWSIHWKVEENTQFYNHRKGKTLMPPSQKKKNQQYEEFKIIFVLKVIKELLSNSRWEQLADKSMQRKLIWLQAKYSSSERVTEARYKSTSNHSISPKWGQELLQWIIYFQTMKWRIEFWLVSKTTFLKKYVRLDLSKWRIWVQML